MLDDTAAGTVRTLRTREVYRSAWMRVREDDVEFADGSTGAYGVVDKRDFVVVLARERGGFWLVEEYRYAVTSRQWQFVQGGWPAGRSGPPAELAAAELREETGFGAGSLTHLGRLNAAHGFCSQGYDVYLASDLVPGTPDREATESDMIARWFTDADVRAMIADGTLADAHSVAALLLFDQRATATHR